MLCIPRSVSPIDVPPGGVPPSPRSKLFSRRRDLSTRSPKPSPRASSNLSSSSATSHASTSTAVTETSTEIDAAHTALSASTPSSTVSKRAGAKWLGFARGGHARKDDAMPSEQVATVASSPIGTVEERYSGTAGQSGSSPRKDTKRERIIKDQSSPNAATGKTFLGLSWRPGKDDVLSLPTLTQARPHESDPSPSPQPPPNIVHDLASDSDDDSDDTAHTADSGDESDLPFTRPTSFSAPPTSFYLPPYPRNSPVRQHPPESPRKPPLRSHTVLLQLTTASLQTSPSPHPLITPRSGGNGTQQLFPRSCNLSRSLAHPRTVFVTLHKTRIIRRLEAPGNLTAAEELSIMDFATRQPGASRSTGGDRGTAVSSSTASIYPSYRQSSRASLMRNLALDGDGELMREVDISAQGQGQDYPTFSKGLKRWLQRPSFEQRASMWTPATQGADIGVIRSAVHRPALKGSASLVFSEGLEALAGVAKNKKRAMTWRGRVARTVTQVMAPLHHPKPGTIALSHLSRPPPEGLPGLLIPLPSSSPASSASGDTAPITPRSNSSSAQNLSSLVSPAFLKKLRQNGGQFDPSVSDEEDLPLGVIVINKRSAEDTQKARMRREEEEKEKKAQDKELKKAREMEKRKMFKDQIAANRLRRENFRIGGRSGSISDDWIDIDTPSPKGSQTSTPTTTRRSSTVPVSSSQGSLPVSSSAQSIRSQSSVRSRPASIRPPSIAASDRSRRSSQHIFTQGMMLPPVVSPQMMMVTPPIPYGHTGPVGMLMPNGQYGFVGMPPSTFFAPPPPISSRSSIRSRTGSDAGSSGEFGTNSSQQFCSLPSRNRPSSILAPQGDGRRRSQHLIVQPSPTKKDGANSLRSASTSSLRSPLKTMAPRRSSFVPPMNMAIN